jgi:DNA-binding NtrC family response regulator
MLEAQYTQQATEPLKNRVLAYERSLIVEALAATGGNQRRAAARLHLLPTTLHEKMKRLGLLQTVDESTEPALQT